MTLNVDSTNYSNVDQGTDIAFSNNSRFTIENYIFTIGNTNIVRFSGRRPTKTKVGSSVTLRAQSINTVKTTDITIQGQNSGPCTNYQQLVLIWTSFLLQIRYKNNKEI